MLSQRVCQVYKVLRAPVRRLSEDGVDSAQASIERRKADVARRLAENGDVAIFNQSKDKFLGLTDVTFEVDGASKEKRVSFYFDSSRRGVAAYQRFVSKADQMGMQISFRFTPHHGQSRVSLEWEQFWDLIGKNPRALPLPDDDYGEKS